MEEVCCLLDVVGFMNLLIEVLGVDFLLVELMFWLVSSLLLLIEFFFFWSDFFCFGEVVVCVDDKFLLVYVCCLFVWGGFIFKDLFKNCEFWFFLSLVLVILDIILFFILVGSFLIEEMIFLDFEGIFL